MATRYTIVVKKSAVKEIRCLPAHYKERIRMSLEHLSMDPFPSGCESIAGYPHHFRIRIGSYRVIYSVEKNITLVTVIRIGHRRDVYKGL